MGELGCGFPLFFDLIKFLLALMGLATIFNIYSLVENY
jgi:hypothetical protein